MAKELPTGSRLAGYSIDRVVAKDGLATTYAAEQVASGRACRLTLFHNVDPDGEPWRRFSRESEQLRALGQPCLPETLEFAVTPEGVPFYAVALPDGEDLASRLRRSGALTTREALAMARQLAAALHAAHSIDILHTALQPENVYLVSSKSSISDGAGFQRALLLGLGVSRLLEASLPGVPLVGQPAYMAPEQVSGLPFDVGPAADQYALALLVYQALTVSQPFRSGSAASSLLQVVRTVPEPVRALRPDLPPHIEAALARALHKERTSRFATLPEFLLALEGNISPSEGLAQLTEPWLLPGKSAEAARLRALAIGGSAPSLASVARELAEPGGEGGGLLELGAVPQAVEDGATIPNTMEDVMRLAVPAPRPAPVESSGDTLVKSKVEISDAGQNEGGGETLVLRGGEKTDPAMPRPRAGAAGDLPPSTPVTPLSRPERRSDGTPPSGTPAVPNLHALARAAESGNSLTLPPPSSPGIVHAARWGERSLFALAGLLLGLLLGVLLS